MKSLLKSCKTLNQTKQIQTQILTNGFNELLPNFLHHLLQSTSNNKTSHTSFQYVQQVFDQLPQPDVFTWACTIRYFSQHGRSKDAIALYIRMHYAGFHPSTYAVAAALKACARISENILGTLIHSQVFKYGFNLNVYVQTSLVDLYSKLGNMETAQRVFNEMAEPNVVSWNSILHGHLKAGDLSKARQVFDEIPMKDVVSWNSMISGYAKAGEMGQANCLFEEMPERNSASWNSVLCGYADSGNMEEARKLFIEMPQRSNVTWIAMISGYSKCGNVDSARKLFDSFREKDLVSWNAMIACYTQNSRPKEALQLFHEMRKHDVNIQPDEMTFSCVISACSQLGDLEFGLWIKTYMSRIGVALDDHLATALIDLYAKCGCIDKAYELFHGLKRKDVVAYSAMILGCGINGNTSEAIRLFDEMITANISPNSVTYTGILTAYNHAGLFEEGYRCFSSMSTDHRLMPTADHYSIMVDLLGRAGKLEEAYKLIKSMPMRPHAGVWGALLLACRVHCNVELGEIAAQHCIELEPDTSGYYSLLANIYASAERWEDAKRLRKVMEEKKLSKIPGCSWIPSNIS
ncbi:Pentatricopeptide repeat-containing protein [Thalictrum thalictroides]|uniref:Pentatricopeptide repeat-containing protein n=1 Tax=Thalictrum thalictroides TaxID=46969 RepID=A0A7J6VGD9_THATH|nr:Pentatricopeptide repeat-containing protein [Thalictrum thalictroides]